MRQIILAFSLLLLFPRGNVWADAVPVNLVSFSVQISPGSARDPLTGLPWELSITSLGNPANVNGELGIADEDVPYTHQSFFVLVDPTTLEPLTFPFVLDVPDIVDENENGLIDFFDRDVATANATTAGRFGTPDGQSDDFSARWNRPLGRTDGSVVLDFPSLGLRFTHDYNIPTYDGVFTYARSNSHLNGSIALTNSASDERLSGPWLLTITNNNRLEYDQGIWNDKEATQIPFFSIDSLERFGTNFVALIALRDGDPQTSAEDFPYWFVVVHSTDANTNNVLDLVESTGGPAAQPELSIARGTNTVQLTINGTAGKTYIIEERDFLETGEWRAVETIPASQPMTAITINATGTARFFRVRQNGP